MNTSFAAAMRRASQETRAQNLAEATKLIQAALAGRAGATAETSDAHERPPTSLFQARMSGDDKPNISEPKRESLGETLRRLKARSATLNSLSGLPGGAGAGAKARVDLAIPDGARFESRHFSCAAGARGFRLYVPASAPARPRGLIVMLHGCTQDPDDFARGTGMNEAAERRGFAVAYPAQTRSDNANGCWNWFEPKHQRRGGGEPAILAGLTEAIVAEFGIDPQQVFIAGLSAGGAMAAVMGETYPELYAAIGVHSGLATNAANDMASAFAAMRGAGKGVRSANPTRYPGRTIVFQGGADSTVHPSNADRIIDAATPEAASISTRRIIAGGAQRRDVAVTVVADQAGETIAELWRVNGAGHAWSGGRAGGSFVDPIGPNASSEMMRFFCQGTPLP